MASNTHILIVDDDVQFRKTLSDILTTKGFRPIAAGTGNEALKQINSEMPDVALIDLKLEDMSGLDLIREIKEQSPNTECILITGCASQESAIDAINLGAYGYMIKPYDIEQLLLMIRRAIDKHESDEMFKTISDTANDAIIMADSNSKIIYWNIAAEEIFGYLSEEIIGKTLQETIVPGKYHEAHSNGIDKFRNTGQGDVIGKTTELTAIRKGGREFPIELSLSSVKMKGKWHAIGIIKDITERKRAELHIKKQKDLLNNVIESITHPFYVMDANDHTIIMANSALNAGNLSRNTTCYNLAHRNSIPCDDKENICPLEEVKRTRKPVTVEHIHYDEAGNPRNMELHAYPLFDDKGNVSQMIEYAIDITERKQAEEKEKLGIINLRKALGGFINTLALTVEQRDPYTSGHQKRVSELARTIAKEMGLKEDQIEGIRMAGVVHDIGKMHIPSEILSRPGKLTDDEFNIVKSHAQVGYDILKGVEFPWPVADIVHQHHESMDGSGYPQGLINGDILLEARILCVADVVEAMASHRPYRPALGMDSALEEISRGKGMRYDSGVVDACIKVVKEKKFSV